MSDRSELLARVASLETRLRSVEDVQAIHRLKARYAELLDQRTPLRRACSQAEIDAAAREVSLLFCEDGVWDGGRALGLATGRDEIFERVFGQIDTEEDHLDRQALAQLHTRILGVDISPDDVEIDEYEELFDELIEADLEPAEAWAGVLAVMLRDPRFIHY